MNGQAATAAENSTLAEDLAACTPLPRVEILRIGSGIARCLARLHATSQLHLDLCPAKVLLSKVGGAFEVRLGVPQQRGFVDAAICSAPSGLWVYAGGDPLCGGDQLLDCGDPLLGSIDPGYASPELLRNGTVDTRSDLFSLGCILYAMSTGHGPFWGATPSDLARSVRETEPRPVGLLNPRLTAWLAAVIMKLLEKDPSRRFADAAQLSDMLSLQASMAGTVRRPPPRSVPVSPAMARVQIKSVVAELARPPAPPNSAQDASGQRKGARAADVGPDVALAWVELAADHRDDLPTGGDRELVAEPSLPPPGGAYALLPPGDGAGAVPAESEAPLMNRDYGLLQVGARAIAARAGPAFAPTEADAERLSAHAGETPGPDTGQKNAASLTPTARGEWLSGLDDREGPGRLIAIVIHILAVFVVGVLAALAVLAHLEVYPGAAGLFAVCLLAAITAFLLAQPSIEPATEPDRPPDTRAPLDAIIADSGNHRRDAPNVKGSPSPGIEHGHLADARSQAGEMRADHAFAPTEVVVRAKRLPTTPVEIPGPGTERSTAAFLTQAARDEWLSSLDDREGRGRLTIATVCFLAALAVGLSILLITGFITDRRGSPAPMPRTTTVLSATGATDGDPRELKEPVDGPRKATTDDDPRESKKPPDPPLRREPVLVSGAPPRANKTMLAGPIAFTHTNAAGSRKGAVFEEHSESLDPVIGFDVTTIEDGGHLVVNSIQAIYQSEGSKRFGHPFGLQGGTRTRIEARRGYAVGAILVHAGSRVDEIKVRFMRQAGKALDPEHSYDSDWVGGSNESFWRVYGDAAWRPYDSNKVGGEGGRGEKLLGGNGRLVIGIHGRSSAHDLEAIGLMQTVEQPTDDSPQ